MAQVEKPENFGCGCILCMLGVPLLVIPPLGIVLILFGLVWHFFPEGPSHPYV